MKWTIKESLGVPIKDGDRIPDVAVSEAEAEKIRAYTLVDMTPEAITELCDAAEQIWNLAGRQAVMKLKWRGKTYASRADLHGVKVYTPEGMPICRRWRVKADGTLAPGWLR